MASMPSGRENTPRKQDDSTKQGPASKLGLASKRDLASKRGQSWARILPWVLAAAFAVLYIAFSVAQWRAFLSPSWDLGIFTQLADKYAHFRAPIVDIKGHGFNLLGDHFHPILVLLGPVFRLFPSGLTLLVVQDLLFALSIAPIARLSLRWLDWGPGVFASLAYGASWGLTAAIAAQFHEIAFAVPLLAYGLVAWLEGRLRTAAVLIALTVFVKEDMGLTVVAFGLVAALTRRQQTASSAAQGSPERAPQYSHQDLQQASPPNRHQGSPQLSPQSPGWLPAGLARTLPDWLATRLDRREGRIGVGLIIWGVFWFFFALLVFLPLFNNAGGWEYTNRLTGSEASFALRLGTMLITLGFTALAAGIVGWISPLAAVAVPTLLWRFIGNVPFYWGMEWHYSAVIMPIMAVALIDGVARIRTRIHPPAHPQADTRSLLQAVFSRKTLAWFAALCAVASAGIGTWHNTFGAWIRGDYGIITNGEREAATGLLDAVAAAEPAGTASAETVPAASRKTVITDIYLLAYLVPENRVYWWGTAQGATPDLVAFSNRTATDPAEWAQTHYPGTWCTVYSEAGYRLAEKVD
ncbi:hypothetical protein ACU21_03930 [Actinobaculum suis]|uniref:DUF2079 domain-containing protein n=1 Tax=Actinobaculum suis TaxID=1657 RepID=UPI00080881D5|nr:DUF2079 domain-containing protein [Actinobaculum suis]OCA95451.1 hypothetical protein ACU21_03930 [Actinobaculum suis]